MPRGFFNISTIKSAKAPSSLVPKCGACRLYESCESPKMEPSGKGRRKILIVGEAPGESEDEAGRQFVSKSGELLSRTLREFGVDMRRDCILTNSLICHPEKDRAPTPAEIEYCRPNTIKTIQAYDPEIIIPLGTSASQSVIKGLYKDSDVGGINLWSGYQIPSQKINAWVCPTFHPSFVLQSDKSPVPKLLFREHLKRALAIESRPWNKVPDYRKQVERILSPKLAAKAIHEFIEACEPIAFDYETTTLKPEYEGAAIVCCSVSNGKRTIAYPWLGEAVNATRELTRSQCLKIASNLKFEERWTRFVFGVGVRNWNWDTMVVAHCIDNRPNTTSIKFQSFVLLGFEAYDEHLKSLLRAKGDRKTNRAESEIDMDQLLLYNGLDSLLEFKVAEIQKELIASHRRKK